MELSNYIEPLSADVFNYNLLSNDVIEIGYSDKAIKLICGADVLGYIWVPFNQLRADRNNNLWVAKWWTNKNWTVIQKKKYFKTYLGVDEHANKNR